MNEHKEMERAEFIKDVHLIYLDVLRKSGITNMFGARPYLMSAHPELSKNEAGKVLTYWMDTFGQKKR